MHAIASAVAPAYFTYGSMRPTGGGGYGSWGPAFPQYVLQFPHARGRESCEIVGRI
jgi:replication factor C subunit 1